MCLTYPLPLKIILVRTRASALTQHKTLTFSLRSSLGMDCLFFFVLRANNLWGAMNSTSAGFISIENVLELDLKVEFYNQITNRFFFQCAVKALSLSKVLHAALKLSDFRKAKHRWRSLIPLIIPCTLKETILTKLLNLKYQTNVPTLNVHTQRQHYSYYLEKW